MRAKEGVLERLNALLTNDLTAINQYFLQAEICRHWGYERLYHKLREFSIHEMRDAEHLVRHILYLEGIPNMQRLGSVRAGETVVEHLELALQLEQQAVAAFAESITHCAQVGDYTTRNILEEMIRDEESHIDWLETQFATIKQVGVENYLAQQIENG